MAPRKSMSRPRQRSSSTTSSSTTKIAAQFNPHRSSNATSGLDLGSSRQDRRQIKHSLLLSRASLSSDRRTPGISKSSIRRQQRSKKSEKKEKLAADLGSLVDALEATTEETNAQADTTPASSSQAARARALLTSTKSIKSKGGMQKRKAAIAAVERQRMGQNMAILTASQPSSSSEVTYDAEAARAEKWAALRRHITAANATGVGATT